MSKEAPLVTDALQQALVTWRRLDSRFTTTGLMHHFDAGSEYTSIAQSEQLREAGIAGPIGTVGDAFDNALMESTIGLFKTEVIQPGDAPSWSSRQQVETAAVGEVDWFNYRRLHSSIGHQPPVEYETEYHRTHARESWPRESRAAIEPSAVHPSLTRRCGAFGPPVRRRPGAVEHFRGLRHRAALIYVQPRHSKSLA
jgi:putative transposase